MDYKHLLVSRDGHVATVTFNRPEVANALNYRHLEEIEHAALSFRDDAETRVVIFTGAGKHFSSGAELGARGDEHDPQVLRRRRKRLGQRCIQALLDMDQITIAAWNGAAMGGGGCIATALDFRIGARDCFLSYPEILTNKGCATRLRNMVMADQNTTIRAFGGEFQFTSRLATFGKKESP